MQAERLPPTFTTAQALATGIHPRVLYRWRDGGDVVELSRGVFRWADAPAATYPDLLAVAARAPRAVICTVTAAIVHELTDVAPHEVQVAVPAGTHAPRITYPPTVVLRFDPATHGLGRTTVEAAPGEMAPVYDAARTVADLLRLRHRFGHDTAWTALHRYLDRPGASRRDLYEYARRLGVKTLMTTALDVTTAR